MQTNLPTLGNHTKAYDIKGNNGCPYDCSEGDGYALLAAAYMADKEIFDGLWLRTHDVRKISYPRYSDCVVPNPNYKYGKNALMDNADAASDGDFDIALALLMAWYQWGDLMGIQDACGNDISYKQEAIDVIKGLVEITNSNLGDCRSTTGNVGFDGYVKNGNTWIETTGFSTNRTPECPEYAGPTDMHVDYMAPAYFKAFREFFIAQGYSGWEVSQLLKAEASSDWIVGEWIYKNQRNVPVGGWVSVTSGSPVWSTFMQGEDFRAPWRTILNYVWHGNPSYTWNPTTHEVTQNKPNTYELDAGVRHTKYLTAPQDAPWSTPCVGFGGGPKLTYKGPATLQWDISPTGAGSSAFTLNWIPATGTPAAVASQDMDLLGLLYRQCVIEWDVTTGGDRYLTSKPVYFHGWFRLLGLLVASGNAHTPLNMLPKANMKLYRAIDNGITYAFTNDELTYKLSYRNFGAVDANDVKIVEHVPDDFIFVSATNNGVYNPQTHTVEWEIGTVKGFKTGGVAITKGEVSYKVRISNNADGRYCTSAEITCSNGFGAISNDYPNNITPTMERNCVDVVARALKIEKTFDRNKANNGNFVTCKIEFENSADAGWIDGGRPGVRVSYAHDGLSTPASENQHALKIRLFHDAVEPYINYGNYRISYFMHDPSINCLAANTGCGTGWVLANDIYEGGNRPDVVVLHEEIVAGSDNRGSWNQRLVAQFAPLLVAPTTHLSNYYGLGIRIHQGGTEPLRAKWRMHTNTYTVVDWSKDWSWTPTANDADDGNYYPITPDWTDIYNPNQAINSWHPNACQTATKTIDNVLVEEFDGYTWRRILGNGPVPGRDITNVVINDTLPAGMTFDKFVGNAPLGISPTIKTIAGGRQVVTWSISKLQVKQKGSIEYVAKVEFPSKNTCETADEEIINYAWIQGDNESPVNDTALITITCAKLPTVVKPSSLKKTANKEIYSVGDEITYTLEYTQNHGTISKPALTSLTDWTGSGWTASNGTLRNNSGTSKITYDWAYGKNGFLEATIVQEEYTKYRVLLRDGAATPITLSLKKEYGTQLVFNYMENGVSKETKTLTYGGNVSPYTLKIDINEGLLRVWINSDTTQSPIYSRSNVPIGIGYAGFINGGPDEAHGTQAISNLRFHFDHAFNLSIQDPIPTEITYTSASNEGTKNTDTIVWNIPSGKGSGIAAGTKIIRTWKGTITTCNTLIENVAYVNIRGHEHNSIAGQVVVACEQTLVAPEKPTVESPITYCQNDSSLPLTAIGTNLKWYNAEIGGNAATEAPTPDTKEVGTTKYYVSQTVNSQESERAVIEVEVLPTPTVTLNIPKEVCISSAPLTLTAQVTPEGGAGAFAGEGIENNIFTPILGNDSIFRYTYTHTGENNCATTQEDSIEVKNLQEANFDIALPDTLCISDNIIQIQSNSFDFTSITPLLDVSQGFNPATATAGESYTLIYTPQEECTKPYTHTITVLSPEKPEAESVSYVYTAIPQPIELKATSDNSIEWYADKNLTTKLHSGATYSPDRDEIITNYPDINSYTYYAVSRIGNCLSDYTEVTVTISNCPIDAPAFESKVQHLCYNEADNAKKTIKINTTTNTIRWYKDDVLLANNTDTYIIDASET